MTGRQPSNTDIQRQVDSAGRERNSVGQTESQTAYWRDRYQHEPYYRQGTGFDRYEPAYRAGIDGNALYRGHRFDEVEADLRSNYETRTGSQAMAWDQGASAACRAAWDRAEAMQSNDRDAQSSR